MLVFRGLEHYPPDRKENVVALGTFDGLHRGHQEVLHTTVTRAHQLALTSLALTFDRHPLEVLQPDRAPIPIISLEEKLDLMGLANLDATLVIPFTREFASTEPEEFVGKVLRGTLRAREVVVGFNHRFGRDARGSSELLKLMAQELGFVVHVISPLVIEGQVVSSSVIREALKSGNVRQARSLLGRPYSVKGRVLRGEGRGHAIGFPTANLRPERELPLGRGVYLVQVEWEGQRANGVTNIGIRPTFGGETPWIETYLLDFSGDLYDRTLSLHFLERLRPEQRFESVQALRTQIEKDVEMARQLLGQPS